MAVGMEEECCQRHLKERAIIQEQTGTETRDGRGGDGVDGEMSNSRASSSDQARASRASRTALDIPLQPPSAPRSNTTGTSSHPMDITTFVTSQRDAALLLGDYNTYHTQLSRRLLNCNKKLGRTTHKNAKYATKKPITAADIGANHEWVALVDEVVGA